MNTYETERVAVFNADCLDALKSLPDACIDSCVTDPPYGLSKEPDVAEVLTKWLAGEDYKHTGGGFMGKSWDSFVPGPSVWREVYRVLKPGAHLLVFSGTRTEDLVGMSVRLAGFERRDTFAWLYGSGFPKSLDVSKAIDKAGGVSPETQAGVLQTARRRAGMSREQVADAIGCSVASVRDWEEGRARASGAAVEFITPSPEYRSALADLLGYTSDERRKTAGVGTDRRNDGTVYGLAHDGSSYAPTPATDDAKAWDGWGTALKPAHEPILVFRKPLAGTVAANVLAHGTGALNIDGCRIKLDDGEVVHTPQSDPSKRSGVVGADLGITRSSTDAFREAQAASIERTNTLGRWPANVVLDEEAAALLDAQTGTLKSGTIAEHHKRSTAGGNGNTHGAMAGVLGQSFGDSGGASRFFYVAKAARSEREEGCENLPSRTGAEAVERTEGSAGVNNPRAGAGRTAKEVRNHHPTVKPVALMRWLVRLVTPPGGTVLDPYAGSGTTGVAAVHEGFNFIGIERDLDDKGEPLGYMQIIQARLEHAEFGDGKPAARGVA